MNLSIIGSGLYGTAIANLLVHNGNKVTMWTEKSDVKEIIVPNEVKVTNDMRECLKDAEIAFVLTSAKYNPSIFESIKDIIDPDTALVLGSKGILDTGEMLKDALKRIIPNAKYAIISGPTFAVDIAALEPLGFTIATEDVEIYKKLKKAIKTVELEYTNDTTGTELCGVLKNAYSIGSGMLDGFHYGPSIRALYITKVLKEIESILETLGCDKKTTYLLCGIGDFVMSATSLNSRNFTFGSVVGLGDKSSKENYLKEKTVEGYENLRILAQIFREKNIDTPILTELYKIILEDEEPKEIIKTLIKK